MWRNLSLAYLINDFCFASKICKGLGLGHELDMTALCVVMCKVPRSQLYFAFECFSYLVYLYLCAMKLALISVYVLWTRLDRMIN